MELIRTPRDMEELYELIGDMRGTQADLARVALMGFQLGYRTAEKAMGLYDETDNALAQHEADKETP